MSFDSTPHYVKKGPAAIELANLSQQKWNDYLSTFVPVENLFAKRSRVSPGVRSTLLGKANADVSQAFAPATNRAIAQDVSRNIAPGSGSFTASLGNAGIRRGMALGTGLAEQNVNADTMGENARLIQARYGEGMSSEGQRGIEGVASLEQSNAINQARNAEIIRNAYMQSAGTVIGMGASAGMHHYAQTPVDPSLGSVNGGYRYSSGGETSYLP